MTGTPTRSPRLWGGLIGLTLLVGMIVPSGLEATPASAGTSKHCGTTTELVPTCGILWGAHAKSGTAVLAQEIGRKPAIAHYYMDWTSDFPSPAEAEAASEGEIVFVDWTARIYGQSSPGVTWQSIASGAEDSAISAMAAQVRAFGHPVMLSFQAEPEQGQYAVYGSPAQYVAAWRHIYDVFADDGVTNVVWVWDTMGEVSSHQYAQWYPGDAYVNWIMWDPYNWYGCKGGARTWRSFSQIVRPMYQWLEQHSGKPGNGDYLSKPWGLAEFGTVEGPTATSKEEWLENVVSTAETLFPRLKALVYFDSTDTTGTRDCPWIVTSSTTSLDGYIVAGENSYASAMLSGASSTPKRPQIVTQPTSVRVNVGARISVVATASGTPEPWVRWLRWNRFQHQWYEIPGETGRVFTIRSARASDSWTAIRAVFGNEYGRVESRVAWLVVRPASEAPRIVEEPKSVVVRVGSRVTLVAKAEGRPRLKVQWQISRNGGRGWRWLRHRVLRVLPLGRAGLRDNGIEYRALFHNGHGVAITRPARVTVRPRRARH